MLEFKHPIVFLYISFMNYDALFLHLNTVLVNGSPSFLFKASRGLRQGDPLSPFLFTIVVEPLRGLVNKVTELVLLDGFVFVRNGQVSVN